MSKSCRSTIRAVLGAVDPEGAMLRCGLLAGHDGEHRFEITWRDPGARIHVADEIERYLMSRREDPDFRRRIRERMEQDAEILKRLAEDES